jgi:hypothetical protein
MSADLKSLSLTDIPDVLFRDADGARTGYLVIEKACLDHEANEANREVVHLYGTHFQGIHGTTIVNSMFRFHDDDD